MFRYLIGFLLCVFCQVAAVDRCTAGDWSQFRGPNSQGKSDSSRLPVTWNETENVIWKTAVPGEGHRVSYCHSGSGSTKSSGSRGRAGSLTPPDLAQDPQPELVQILIDADGIPGNRVDPEYRWVTVELDDARGRQPAPTFADDGLC